MSTPPTALADASRGRIGPLLVVGLVLMVVGGVCFAAFYQRTPDEPLRVGVLVWPPYEMAFLARELGYYDDASIDLIDYQSPADVLRAYHDGSVDVVMFTIDYALKAFEQDPGNHHVILSPDVSLGGDALIADPSFATLEDLRGKRVGIESSVLGAYMLTRAMESADMSVDDVEVVFVDIPDQEHAFDSGTVDAVVTYEPTRSRLVADGARELFSSAELPGEIVDIVLVNGRTREAKREQLTIFVQGWLRAVDAYRADPLGSARKVSGREGLSAEEFVATFDGVRLHGREENLEMLSGDQPALRRSIESVMRVMVERGFLEEALDTRTLVDGSFVAAEP